jgi:hypothetical protein
MNAALRTLLSILLIGVSAWVSGCSKSDPTPSRTQLLTGPKWRLTESITIHTDPSGHTSIVSPLPDPCPQDAFYKYTAAPSRTYTHTKAANLICQLPASESTWPWEFDNLETDLVFQARTPFQFRFHILTLTDKKLVVVSEFYFNRYGLNGIEVITAKNTSTFAAF